MMEVLGRHLALGSARWSLPWKWWAHRMAILGTDDKRSPCRIYCNFGTAVICCTASCGDGTPDMIGLLSLSDSLDGLPRGG